MTTFALIKDGGAFIGTSQLLGVVANLLATALCAVLSNDTGSVHVTFRERLHL